MCPSTTHAHLKRVDAAYERRTAAQPRLEAAPQLLRVLAAGAHEHRGRERTAQPQVKHVPQLGHHGSRTASRGAKAVEQ